MEDPQRCCFWTLTSPSFGELTPRSVPLPAVSPAPAREDPHPDDLAPTRIPSLLDTLPSFNPTIAIRSFYDMLMATCRFAGAPPQVPSESTASLLMLAWHI